MPATPQSHIRAYVHFKQPTVYAGEELECVIEFRNIARPPGAAERADVPNGGALKDRAGLPTHSRQSSRILSRAPSTATATAASTQGGFRGKGHRPTLSLNVASGSSRGGNNGSHSQSNSISHPGVLSTGSRPAKGGHGRSLSILSLGSEAISEGRAPKLAAMPGTRPTRAHMRSASLQYPPKHPVPSPVGLGLPAPRQPSPLYETTTPPPQPELSSPHPPVRPPRRRPGTVSAGSTPQLGKKPSIHVRNPSKFDSNMSSFKFPPDSDSTPQDAEARPKIVRTPSTMHSGQRRSHSPRPPENWTNTASILNPLTRVMTEESTDGTPRTSSEFSPTSNHSDETLTSEHPLQQQQSGRLLPKYAHSRQASQALQVGPAEPETLMMAYAQTMGHFTLDGSLVNAAPFEEVKRKGVQGRGGVVGVERPKRASGLFGALSWGNLGESLGGLLGGDEMSSMAQMKASAGSKTIPLLSTPQSLLFVDLRLAPGESKSYSYRFSLPRGLPPSHRGRAIKVTYHLSLGVQRPEGQVVKRVEVPFRVLGSYDSQGDALGHDLMSPYVLLQDAARTSAVKPDRKQTNGFSHFATKNNITNQRTPKEGLEDFLRYTERLMEAPVDVHGALLSPTSPLSPPSFPSSSSRQHSSSELRPANVREAIDFAILRSNFATTSGDSRQPDAQSVNRFNITRSGHPVAVLIILRPAYRLGEAVTGTIDFTAPSDSSAQAPTFSVLVELESAEHVDPSLALRSSTSIHRVTRKVHALSRENSLYARQLSFNLAIPSNASPSFETTGVSLTWRLRIEFTTQRHVPGQGFDSLSGFMEEIARDDRGVTSIARERLAADTFEIGVPIKVYGAVGVDSLCTESGELVV